MGRDVTRREFCRQAAVTAILLAARGDALRADTAPRLRGPASGARVLVLGAGLAGLAAAFELATAGYDATVLEARTRAGGRVYTLREAFPDDLYAEAGATRISDTHDWVLKYVDQFGLALEPFKPAGLADVYELHGHRLVVRNIANVEWPLALTADEQRLGLEGMRAKYLDAAFQAIGDAGAPGAPPPSLASFDAVSYEEFLRHQGASADAVLLLTLGSGRNENAGTSALMRLRAAVWRARTRHWWKIRGGNDQLPRAFAARLADRIAYGTAVTRIEWGPAGVRVLALRGGRHVEYQAQALVCTIPLPVLRTLEIHPAFPPSMRRAIDDYGYGSVTKTVLQTRSRFWEREGLSGFGVTDRPVQEVWHMSAGQASRRGLLVTYTTGHTVPRLAGAREVDRVAWAAREAEYLFPGLREDMEGGVAYAWDEDRWAGAAYPQPAPGQLIPFLSLLRQPVGRVHFAGDHASAWPAWMQGALESGNHAARAIAASI